jgi:SAM-dependent methyltransferase
MSSEWSDPRRVSDYLAREIPHRDAAEALLLEALPTRIESFLDLGTGDGRLLSLVRQQHPEARGVGLDVSGPMLARAHVRCDADASIELHEHDLADPLTKAEWTRGRALFDAVVSGLAIHHLADQRKRSLFGEVHDRLRPGGVFVNLDLTTSPLPRFMPASAKRSAVFKTIPPTGSPTPASSSPGCVKRASQVSIAASSGWS